ncbi:PREDICTED: uncharacterized protein DDB_G0290685-like [Camelina sativa]|uniref:Uncharacterized protein DDB_G0290685-like n=1 Tax=Camelina sativa TaxID=90675 RepID=A0ABM0VYZ1_CAMSA|nr:PREDICTED: uncharacterized protein DDB_G0290685-like [Camelina sativa]
MSVSEKHEKIEKNLSDSEKLDIILFMLEDFNKRLEAIEEAVKTTSEKDKNKGSHGDEDGQNRNEESHEDEDGQNRKEEVINEEAGKQNIDGDIPREDFVDSPSSDSVRPSNTQDGSFAGDDENTQKTEGDGGNYFEEIPKDKSPSPRPSTPNFDLLSQEDQDSGKDKSMGKEKGASSKKRVLRERKQRESKQTNDGDDDVTNRKQRKKRKPSDNPDQFVTACPVGRIVRLENHVGVTTAASTPQWESRAFEEEEDEKPNSVDDVYSNQEEAYFVISDDEECINISDTDVDSSQEEAPKQQEDPCQEEAHNQQEDTCQEEAPTQEEVPSQQQDHTSQEMGSLQTPTTQENNISDEEMKQIEKVIKCWTKPKDIKIVLSSMDEEYRDKYFEENP